MKKSPRFAFVILIVALFFVACSHKPIVPNVTFVTAFEDNKTVLIQEGGVLHLELESEATGDNRWVVDGTLPPEVRLVGKPQLRAYTDAMGSANMVQFDFKGVKVGEYIVKLVYKNQTTGEVKKTFTITLDVHSSVDVFVK